MSEAQILFSMLETRGQFTISILSLNLRSICMRSMKSFFDDDPTNQKWKWQNVLKTKEKRFKNDLHS